MNVVETVAEGETVATHAQLNPIHCVVGRPTHSNSPGPTAPSTPPPMLLQPVASAAATVPASPNSLTKILPSNLPSAISFISHLLTRCVVSCRNAECQFQAQHANPIETQCRHFKSHGKGANCYAVAQGDVRTCRRSAQHRTKCSV